MFRFYCSYSFRFFCQIKVASLHRYMNDKLCPYSKLSFNISHYYNMLLSPSRSPLPPPLYPSSFISLPLTPSLPSPLYPSSFISLPLPVSQTFSHNPLKPLICGHETVKLINFDLAAFLFKSAPKIVR